MKIRYLSNRKKLIAEIETDVLPRVGETLVGFGDSYEVVNVCYFFSINKYTLDHINVTLVSEIEAARQRYLEIAKLNLKVEDGNA